MALLPTGPIGLFEIRTELGIANTQQIGLLDTNVRTLAGQPSGDVELPTDFYGKSVIPASGTYLSQFCSGYDLYYRYANGTGGYYDTLQQANSASCGWPPASGIYITQYCSGYNLYYRYTDGSGGYYDTLQETNSASCGWPPAATYQLSAASTSINEGYGFTVNVTTTNFNNGTGSGDIYWRIVHNTTTSADFTLDSGVSTVSNNSSSFTFYATADQVTEGVENFYVVISLTAGGTAVASTSTINVIDTSQTPVTTYNISFLQNPIKEGENLYVTVNTTNYADSYMYWSIPSLFTDMLNDDFANNITRDTDYYFSIANGTGTFYIPTAHDTNLESGTVNPSGTNFVIRLKNTTLNQVKVSEAVLVNEWNEVLTGPSAGSPGTSYTVNISNGVPNSGFSWTRDFVQYDPPQYGTLDAAGTYVFSGLLFPSTPVPKSYAFTFTFATTGNVRNYSIYIS